MEAPKLTPRQQRFCEEYITDHNQMQAAIRAGYSAKTAKNNAARLMENDGIKKEIERLEKRLTVRCRVTPQWVVDQIADIAENGGRDNDRLKALEMLAKYFQMFEKKDETDTKIEIVIGDEAREWLV